MNPHDMGTVHRNLFWRAELEEWLVEHGVRGDLAYRYALELFLSLGVGIVGTTGANTFKTAKSKVSTILQTKFPHGASDALVLAIANVLSSRVHLRKKGYRPPPQRELDR